MALALVSASCVCAISVGALFTLVAYVLALVCRSGSSLAHGHSISTIGKVLHTVHKSQGAVSIVKRGLIAAEVEHDVKEIAAIDNAGNVEVTERGVGCSTLAILVEGNGEGVGVSIPTDLSTVPSTYKVLFGKLGGSCRSVALALVSASCVCAISVGALFTLVAYVLALVCRSGSFLAHVELISTIGEVLTVSKSEYTVLIVKRNHVSVRSKVHHNTVAIKDGDVSDSELTKSGVSNSTALTELVDNDYEGVVARVIERAGLSTVPSTCKVLSGDLCRSCSSVALALVSASVLSAISVGALATSSTCVLALVCSIVITVNLDHLKVSALGEVKIGGLLGSKSEGTGASFVCEVNTTNSGIH